MFKNEDSALEQSDGLTYTNSVVGDLVNKDTDGDEVLDWEEGLWGTDPTKKDTNEDGILDDAEVAKLKAEGSENNSLGLAPIEAENLTETDKFAQELFTTVAALSQGGALDEAAVAEISNSLAEQIENSVPRKVFTLKDIKVINDATPLAIQAYNNNLYSIYKKYPLQNGTIDVLKELIADEENLNILLKLDPIISQKKQVISELQTLPVPGSLSLLHLDLVNISQRILENVSDMKLFESDTIVAMSAIAQYEKNATDLEVIAGELSKMISEKLNN